MLAPLALLAPLVFGYLLATRVLREADPVAVAVLALGLGANALLLVANLVLHALPMERALPVALAVLAAGALALLALPRRPRPARPWGRGEAIAAAATALLVLACVVVEQSRNLDDDYWMHAPVIRLFLAGQFPPVNPFLPDVALRGHYGRALTVALIARIAGTDALPTMTWVTALLQTASFLAWLTLGRRFLAGSGAAFLAAFLPFFAVHQDWIELYRHTGLAQIYMNNNTLVSLDLALLVRVLLEALPSRRLAPRLLAGALLGLCALVYETLYACLSAALVLVVPLLARGRMRVRGLLLRTAVPVLALSVGLALVQGGVLTEVARPWVAPEPPPAGAMDARAWEGATQTVSVGFPKHPFLHVTDPGGRHVPLWDGELLRRAGPMVWCLPVLFVWAAARRRGLPLLLCGFGLVSVLVPATVDFGRNNHESIRFLFYAGVAGAAAMAWAAGEALAAARARSGAHAELRSALGIALAALALALPSLAWIRDDARHVAAGDVPGFMDPEAILHRLAPASFGPADAAAARWIGARAAPGDRFLARVPIDDVKFYHLGTLAALSGCAYAGGAVDFTAQQDTSAPTLLPLGFRARAFWRRPARWAAQELGVRWLLADSVTDRATLEALADVEGLQAVRRFDAGDGRSKVVYEVVAGPAPPLPPPADVATWGGLVQRAEVRRTGADGAALLHVTLANRGAAPACLPAGTFVRYRLGDLARRQVINPVDQIAAPVDAVLAPGAKLEVDLPFVAAPGNLSAGITLGSSRGAIAEVPRSPVDLK